MGDTGYFPSHDKLFARAITSMNTFDLAFVVHDGDIQNQPTPETPCGDERLYQVRDIFNTLEAPMIFTPGDNEWSDCTDDAVRLASLRSIFFPDQYSLGQQRRALTRQQAPYVENARWTQEGVVFATLNVPGPNDNNDNHDEYTDRRKANLAWLDAAFDKAEEDHAPAVMIIWQVNPFAAAYGYSPDGSHGSFYAFKGLVDTLKRRTVAFGKPVVLVHGDTHIFRITQPWPDVPTFTEVETHALDDSDSWLRVTVDSDRPEVFTFTTELAPPAH